jgi:hypothetical protein
MVFRDMMWVRLSFGDFTRHFDAVMPAIIFKIYDVVPTCTVYTVLIIHVWQILMKQSKTRHVDIRFIKFNFSKQHGQFGTVV